MKRLFISIAAAVLPTLLAVAADGHTQPFVPELRRFGPHAPMLADAVRAADIIFTGVTTQVDLSQYHGIGKGTYSGAITPQTFLKGRFAQRELNLTWEPSATGIKPGSNHIFFIRAKDGGFNVVKEIYVHQSPYMCSRTYWVYDGGTEATLQTIRLLVTPSEPLPEYPATLLADLKQPAGQRQATAVMLACEAMRPECLDPLLYAITHHVRDYVHAIYGACRLDGEQAATAALALVAAHTDEQPQIFEAIGAAKNPKSVPILDQFGTEHPEYRASCAFAIREIDPTKLADAVRRWRADGKHTGIKHTFYRIGWRVDSYSADELLTKALNSEKVFNHD